MRDVRRVQTGPKGRVNPLPKSIITPGVPVGPKGFAAPQADIPVVNVPLSKTFVQVDVRESKATQQLRQSIRSAKEQKAVLDECDDNLKVLIPEIEECLKALELGVPLWMEIEPRDEDGETTSLGFVKMNNNWRLVLQTSGPHYEGDDRPLKDCGRQERMKAYKKLPLLMQAAANQLKHMINERTEVFDGLTEMLAVLREEVAK